jgi:ankyrin repeat protein
MARAKKNDEKTDLCFTAIANRDLVAARELLASGANPNAKDKDGSPMVSYAFWGPTVDLLLEFGADINAPNGMGRTVLHNAAEYGSRQQVEFFVSRGADPHACNRNDVTVLHSAAGNKKSAAGNKENGRELCQLFIELGVSPDSWTENQYLPVHFAASHGTVDTCRLFTELGYSSSLIPANALPEYRTPFQCAVSSGDIAKVQYYMDECGESLDQLTLDGRPMRRLVNKAYVDMHAFLKSATTMKAVDRSLDVGRADLPALRRSSPAPI